MTLLAFRQRLFLIDFLGVFLSILLNLVLHDFDKDFLETVIWTIASACFMYFFQLFLYRENHLPSTHKTSQVDATENEKVMMKIVFWTHLLIAFILVFFVIILDKPFSKGGWMLIVLGNYLGRNLAELHRFNEIK